MKIVHPIAGEVSLDSIKHFIYDGKFNTLVDEKRVEHIGRGVMHREYSNGQLTYTDTFNGLDFSVGMEIVTFKGIPFWGMSRNSRFTCPEPFEQHRRELRTEVDGLLRHALTSMDRDFPYRGPVIDSDSAEKAQRDTPLGNLSYTNCLDVDNPLEVLPRFHGRDEINLWASNQEYVVLETDYHGGLLVPRDFVKTD